MSDSNSFQIVKVVRAASGGSRALSLGKSGARSMVEAPGAGSRYIDQSASHWRQSVRSGDNPRPWFLPRGAFGKPNKMCRG